MFSFMGIETIAMAVLPSLCVSIIMACFNRRQSRQLKAQAEREQNRKQGDMLIINLTLAAAKLSYAVAMAIKNGHPNGEIEEGVNQYKAAMRDLKQFERGLIVDTRDVTQ